MQTSSECLKAARRSRDERRSGTHLGNPRSSGDADRVPLSPPSDIGLSYAVRAGRAPRLERGFYGLRRTCNLQAARLPMCLTRAAIDRPRRASSLQLPWFRHPVMRVRAVGPISTGLLALVGPTRAVLGGGGSGKRARCQPRGLSSAGHRKHARSPGGDLALRRRRQLALCHSVE
jgi:hypothetical protein